MSEHLCPIEPYDWNNGDGGAGDPDTVQEICPACEAETVDQGDGTWKCGACGHVTKEPVCREIDRNDFEPDYGDFG